MSNEPTTTAPAENGKFSPPVTLDTPIERNGQKIDVLVLRKPQSGELRGLSLFDLTRLDVDSLHNLLPRITMPPITKAEAMAMDSADLLACGAEVSGFLLQKARQPELYPAS